MFCRYPWEVRLFLIKNRGAVDLGARAEVRWGTEGLEGEKGGETVDRM